MHQHTTSQLAGPMANPQSPGQYGAQQPPYGGMPQQAPAAYGQQMAYGGPPGTASYGRGQPAPQQQQWAQPAPPQGFAGGQYGYGN